MRRVETFESEAKNVFSENLFFDVVEDEDEEDSSSIFFRIHCWSSGRRSAKPLIISSQTGWTFLKKHPVWDHVERSIQANSPFSSSSSCSVERLCHRNCSSSTRNSLWSITRLFCSEISSIDETITTENNRIKSILLVEEKIRLEFGKCSTSPRSSIRCEDDIPSIVESNEMKNFSSHWTLSRESSTKMFFKFEKFDLIRSCWSFTEFGQSIRKRRTFFLSVRRCSFHLEKKLVVLLVQMDLRKKRKKIFTSFSFYSSESRIDVIFSCPITPWKTRRVNRSLIFTRSHFSCCSLCSIVTSIDLEKRLDRRWLSSIKASKFVVLIKKNIGTKISIERALVRSSCSSSSLLTRRQFSDWTKQSISNEYLHLSNSNANRLYQMKIVCSKEDFDEFACQRKHV